MNVYKLYGYFFGFPKLAKYNMFLHRLALRGMGLYNYENNSISGEEWVLKNIVKKLGLELVVFDVGANVGEYSKLIENICPFSKNIFAFEPHPATFLKLKENTSNIKKLKCYNAALSDSDGDISIFDRDISGTSHASVHGSVFSDIYGVQAHELKVDSYTLDMFCLKESVNTIDFLKIDVEGHELNVLKGAVRLIENKKIKVIQFEFTQLNSSVGVFFKDFWELLSPHYSLYRLLPHGLLCITQYNPVDCELFGYQNYLAILQ